MRNTKVISTVLFECKNVNAYKIPPGNVSLSKWNLLDQNIVWRGSAQLIEEEVIDDELEAFAPVPDKWSGGDMQAHGRQGDHLEQGLRLKLVLYNNKRSSENCDEHIAWAETWYNPLSVEGDEQASDKIYIANDRQETIQATESRGYYKIISQLPGSGYHPYLGETYWDESENAPLQVALGLRFADSFDAISFSESLALYKRRFKNFEEQYQYEKKLLEIEKKLRNLSLDDDGGSGDKPALHSNSHLSNDKLPLGTDETNDLDDDEFGDFATAE